MPSLTDQAKEDRLARRLYERARDAGQRVFDGGELGDLGLGMEELHQICLRFKKARYIMILHSEGLPADSSSASAGPPALRIELTGVGFRIFERVFSGT